MPRWDHINLVAYYARRGKPCPEPAREVESEEELHNFLLSECRRRHWIALHGSMAHRTHRTMGEPDFVILADGGRTLLVECKKPGEKPSPAQWGIIHHAQVLGHKVHIARSVEEIVGILREFEE